MELKTLKQYAKDQGISYEAVRKQVVRYAEDLADHVVKKDRVQYLDQWAIDFLTERRKESPIVLVNMDQSEEIDRLKEQIEILKVQLMTAQNELLKEKDRIISLQDETKQLIEDRGKYTALLEDSKTKEERLKEAEDQISVIRKEAEDLRKERDEAQKEAQSFRKSIFGFYRKV